jgi:aryl-alcohol dehydrogenase-like predicted oxidoreductase
MYDPSLYCFQDSYIADAPSQFSIPRHRLTILTKCFSLVTDDISVRSYFNPGLRDLRDYVNQSGLSRAAIFNQVEASLARLGTDYIDLLQIHRMDLENADAEETMKALHDLVQAGKVRYLGASSMFTWQFHHYNHVAEVRISLRSQSTCLLMRHPCVQKNGWTPFISMQNQYSLL